MKGRASCTSSGLTWCARFLSESNTTQFPKLSSPLHLKQLYNTTKKAPIRNLWICVGTSQNVRKLAIRLGGRKSARVLRHTMNGLFVCLLYRSHLIRFANDNDKHANAGQLNSATHLRALLVLRDRGIYHAHAMMTSQLNSCTHLRALLVLHDRGNDQSTE
jgi:hypothetical protein